MFRLFKVAQFVVLCYSSTKVLIHRGMGGELLGGWTGGWRVVNKKGDEYPKYYMGHTYT